MQHADFKGKVEEKFKEDHWDVPRAEALAARCKVARELFEAESEEVKERIRTEAKEEHQEELERWKDANKGLPSADSEEQVE
jgi:uncharacterized protein with HEPN domain